MQSACITTIKIIKRQGVWSLQKFEVLVLGTFETWRILTNNIFTAWLRNIRELGKNGAMEEI